MLEKMASEAICSCLYYDLMDNMDNTPTKELIEIIQGNFNCDICNEVNLATSKRFNGWTNYETWLANVWLSNDFDSCQIFVSVMAIKEDKYCKAKKIEEIMRDRTDNLSLDPSLASDLLNSSFGQINWLEIVSNY